MLNKAIEYAKNNPIQRLPKMAAVIVNKRGKIVAVGYNQYRTHPLQKQFASDRHKVHLHCEIDAIRKALKEYERDELSDMTIYIARIYKDGLPALAAPCPGCKEALEYYGITKVEYTSDATERHRRGSWRPSGTLTPVRA